MTTDEQNAALREENARLQEECLYASVRQERDQLRAQVAALVEALRIETERIEFLRDTGGIATTGDLAEFAIRFRKRLNAPDLAALVAREQSRDAVVTALLDLARYDDFSAQGCEHCAPDDPHDFDRARVRLGEELRALAALDAVEK